jgi:hypothetical protein
VYLLLKLAAEHAVRPVGRFRAAALESASVKEDLSQPTLSLNSVDQQTTYAKTPHSLPEEILRHVT